MTSRTALPTRVARLLQQRAPVIGLRPVVVLIAALGLAGLTAWTAPLPNRVLRLDGKGSYVELPAGLFDSLTNATVEGWVKWDTLGNWSRFVDFGEPWRTMAVSQDGLAASLEFEIWPRQANGAPARDARRVAARRRQPRSVCPARLRW